MACYTAKQLNRLHLQHSHCLGGAPLHKGTAVQPCLLPAIQTAPLPAVSGSSNLKKPASVTYKALEGARSDIYWQRQPPTPGAAWRCTAHTQRAAGSPPDRPGPSRAH